MVQIEGKYEHTGNEGFIEYLTSLGPELGSEVAKKIAEASSVLTVKKEGNKVTLVEVSGPSTTTKIFTLEELFEEELLKAIKVESIGTIAGNKLTLKSTSKDGRTGERIYEFADSGLIITYTSSNSDNIGKRIYKRA